MKMEDYIRMVKEQEKKQLKLVLCKRKNEFGENEALIAFLNQNEFYYVIGKYKDEEIVPGSCGRIIESYYSGVTFSKLEDAFCTFNNEWKKRKIMVLKSSINSYGYLFYLVACYEKGTIKFVVCSIDKESFIPGTNYKYVSEFKNGIYFNDLTIALNYFNSNLK